MGLKYMLIRSLKYNIVKDFLMFDGAEGIKHLNETINNKKSNQ